MKHYNVFLMILMSVLLLISCSNENKIETSAKKEVVIAENSETIELKSIHENSSITWRAWHLGGVGKRYGKIYLKTVSALINKGKLSNLKVEIDMNSLTVDSFSEEETEKKEKLTLHLQSNDFFDVENYPITTFEMTSIKPTEGKFNSTITGNLTIKDSTKSITFNANIMSSDEEVSILSEDFIINRSDWGLTYHQEGTKGVPLDYIIADDIGFTIDVRFE